MYVPHNPYYYHHRSQYSVSSTSMAEDGFPASGEGKLSTQIRQQIEILNGKIAETGVDLDRCKQDQENFRLEYYKSRESNAKFQSMEEQVRKCIWIVTITPSAVNVKLKFFAKSSEEGTTFVHNMKKEPRTHIEGAFISITTVKTK